MTGRRLAHLALVVTTAVLAGSTLSCGKGGSRPPLLCYVGGTMRPVMEELAHRYRARAGQEVLIDYAGSGELLIRIQQTQRGDLYVAHDPFLAALMKKGLGVGGWTTASVTPVIVVAKGNPRGIKGLRHLARPGIKLVLSHPEYSTMGHLVPAMAKKAGLLKEIEANVVSRTRGGGAAANKVILGAADASVVWNAVAHLRRDKLDAVPIEPELRLQKGVDAVTSATLGRIEMGYIRVTVATLTCSKDLAAATAFAQFAASEENAGVWKEFGFSAADQVGSARAAKPLAGSILVHCGAGMRPPISKLAREFEKTSGVKTEVSYAGSNKLLGQIVLIRRGDLYIPGDADYVDLAAEKGLVKSRKTICYFVPVIMVRKGNPKGIKSLADLTRPGLKIGQGDERACAIGRLTPKLLALNGVDRAAWKKNVVLVTPTVNELALKIKLASDQLESVDAVVVWSSIAAMYPKDSDIVTIDPAKNIVPEVAGAVLTTAKNPGAASAFLDFLTSARGRRVLVENGYVVEKP